MPLLWDPWLTFRLDEQDKYYCIGKAKTRGRECHNRIPPADWNEAKHQLKKLARKDPHSSKAKRQLREIASLMLCSRWHGTEWRPQQQIDEVAHKWERRMRQVVLEEESEYESEEELEEQEEEVQIEERHVSRRHASTVISGNLSRHSATRVERPSTPPAQVGSLFASGLPTPPSTEPRQQVKAQLGPQDLPTPPSSEPRAAHEAFAVAAGAATPVPSSRARRSRDDTSPTRQRHHQEPSSQHNIEDKEDEDHISTGDAAIPCSPELVPDSPQTPSTSATSSVTIDVLSEEIVQTEESNGHHEPSRQLVGESVQPTRATIPDRANSTAVLVSAVSSHTTCESLPDDASSDENSTATVEHPCLTQSIDSRTSAAKRGSYGYAEILLEPYAKTAAAQCRPILTHHYTDTSFITEALAVKSEVVSDPPPQTASGHMQHVTKEVIAPRRADENGRRHRFWRASLRAALASMSCFHASPGGRSSI